MSALKNGSVLVLPTDTVYGLVCDATNENIVENIFKIKKRSKSKSLPIFVEDLKMAKKYAEINDEQEKTIKKHWPGKYTFVLKIKNQKSKTKKKSQIINSKLLVKNGTIALRQPNYKIILDIIKTLKRPLAQTSANISEMPATTEVEKVIEYFDGQKNQPDIILDLGNLKKNKPSTIIDLTLKKNKILRK